MVTCVTILMGPVPLDPSMTHEDEDEDEGI